MRKDWQRETWCEGCGKTISPKVYDKNKGYCTPCKKIVSGN